MRQFIQVFNNLPIVQKLLLTSIIPIIALVLLSLVTYESVQTFSNDEEQLNNIYLVQRRAAEYMRLIVDLETGFRGYVLTEQNSYLEYPYQFAKERIVSVGDSLEQAVGGREPQHKAIMQVQQRVKQLIREKDQLIEALAAGRPADALDYIERGVGRAHMMEIRELMTRFDRLEQDVLNEALMKLAQDRTSMMRTILGGGTLTL
ncbi:MAG: histidine kinase, partial [Nitrospiraceae bacterium]